MLQNKNNCYRSVSVIGMIVCEVFDVATNQVEKADTIFDTKEKEDKNKLIYMNAGHLLKYQLVTITNSMHGFKPWS